MNQPGAVQPRRQRLLASAAPDRRLRVVKPAPRFTVQVESFIDIAHETPPLWLRFGKELGRAPTDIDWQALFNLTMAGVLRVTTARYDGKLAGFALNMVGPHLFHKSTCFGITNAVWLDREYRRSWYGYQFLRANRDNLREWGCKVVYITNPDATVAGMDKLYRRLGYVPDELNYIQRF